MSLRQLEEATRRAVSPDSAARLGRVVYEEEARLIAIVGSSPTKVDSGRALALGAPPTPTIDGMIREYCEDFGDALAEVVALVEKKEEASTIVPNSNRVVTLITGGSSIGRAVARRLAGGGWGGADGRGHGPDGMALRVGQVLAGRRAAPLDETRALWEEVSKGKSSSCPCPRT